MAILELDPDRRPLVLVAGGGVAALEACLALRTFVTADDVDIELMTPGDRFEYRPLAVLEPFDGEPAWTLSLEAFAADQDLALVRDALIGVEPDRRVVRTVRGAVRPYDLLLVAVGARTVSWLPGAVSFGGGADARTVRRMLDAAAAGRLGSIAFAVPGGAYWSLPLYELALLCAARLERRAPLVELLLVTPEPAPLALFGRQASALVGELLAEHRVRVECGVEAVSAHDGAIALRDGRRLAADAVLSLPRLAGRSIPGLPYDSRGFVATDGFGRVEGLDSVYAAGDITRFPLKQGGLATQQADAAAEAMLAELGLPIAPRPFEPVLKGVLYSDGDPAYLQFPLAGEDPARTPAPRAYSLWWPPSKIAGRHLSPYLTIRAGAPRAPEVRAEAILPVEVALARPRQRRRRVPGARAARG